MQFSNIAPAVLPQQIDDLEGRSPCVKKSVHFKKFTLKLIKSIDEEQTETILHVSVRRKAMVVTGEKSQSHNMSPICMK